MGKFSEGLLNHETILANLTICAGQTILDAGCGNGYMAKKFSALVGAAGKIYALDPDKISIANLKKEDTPFGPPVEMRSSPGELRQKVPLTPGMLLEISEHFYMQLFENA
jgi:hypothetical protein